MNRILFFEEIEKTMVSRVGGKGANLGEMTGAGFPVPRGFCLTTEIYDAFAEGLSLEDLAGEEARSLLRQRNLPENCRTPLEEALKRFPEGTLFSVRSSATAEDLPYASFAGQQDTYLNVRKEDIPEAVKDCFVSLYTDRAVSYRKQNGIGRPGISVVIQEMVPSDSSGVMFTADPVSGNRTKLVIDAVFGLGEAIVSGLVSPDHIVWDRKKGRIETRQTARKEFAILPLPEGGTRRKELQTEEPVLSDEQVRELAELGIALEKHYGMPQDVEWAVRDGKIFILQTRAITSLYPVPETEDGRFHFFFNLGYQQMYTKAMPVMALDCLCGAVNIKKEELQAFRPTFARPVGGHLFVDYSMIMWIRPLRGLFLKRFMRAMDPLVESAVTELLERHPKLPHPDPALPAAFRNVRRAFRKALRSEDPYATALEMLETLENRSDKAIEAVRAEKPGPEALPVLFRSCLAIETLTDTFAPTVVAGALALKQLEKMEERMGCPGKWTRDIQVGNEGNIATEMNLHLGDLADLAAGDPNLQALLQEEGEDLQEKLMKRQDAFGEAYRTFMEKYGFRCPGELDISQPRWRDDATALIAQIRTMAKGKETGSHRREYEDKNRKAREQGEELVRAVREKLGERSARKARLQLERYRAYFPKREHFKYYWMRTFGEVRVLLLEIGEILAERGQIEKKEDIMHLHMMDVYRVLPSGEDLKPLVEQNRIEFDRVARLTPPRILTGEGEVLMGRISRKGLPEGALAGMGVSAGCVEGIARVITDPSEATVGKGEILVAPFTDPGWTPLFVDAAAVVTEIGGTLTHGAVVAREYGIPGVVGVTDATKIIRTGQRIRVDGTEGFVMLLEEAED